MSKRPFRPIYTHNGFALRPAKKLSNGGELLYCIERRTNTQCGALGRRELDGTITLSKPHSGHLPDDTKTQAKKARFEMKELAGTSGLAPKEILQEATMRFGVESVIEAGSVEALKKMIGRQRNKNNKKCQDSEEAGGSTNKIIWGETIEGNDDQKFTLTFNICPCCLDIQSTEKPSISDLSEVLERLQENSCKQELGEETDETSNTINLKNELEALTGSTPGLQEMTIFEQLELQESTNL